LLAIITTIKLFIAYVDVNLAYLNTKLYKYILIDYPYGFEGEAPGYVYYLLQSLYGLK